MKDVIKMEHFLNIYKTLTYLFIQFLEEAEAAW